MIIIETIKKIIKKPKLGVLLLFVLGVFFAFGIPKKAEAAYNPSYILPDSVFTNSGTMSEAQIQQFLVSKNSYLANYTVPAARYVSWNGVSYYEGTMIGPIGHEVDSTGWRASRVIYQVSQWYGINPQVILVTLQKESSLITTPQPAYYGLVQWAMGYAYTESGIRPVCDTATNNNPTGSCAGFAMQVDWGGGGLKYFYNCSIAGGCGLQYYAGNTILLDGSYIYIGNHCTAALYRYTPHNTYGGNFTTNFNSWFNPYDYEFVSAQNPPQYVGAGDTVSAQLMIRNTGTATWKNDSGDPSNPLRLYVASGSELYSNDGTWVSSIRIKMTTATVAPGETATFNFTIKAPLSIGTFYLHMIPRAEAIGNMKDLGMVFGITTPTWHSYQFISAINPPATMQPGQTYDVRIILKNTGSALWNSDTIDPSFRPMRLAVISGSPNFYEATTWANTSRIKMTTSSAKYNQLAQFSFKMKAPVTPGYYKINFTPIIENLIQYPNIGMAFGSTVVGSGPVHRYWNQVRGGHFYTASHQEKLNVDKDPSWKYEGAVFNIDYVSAVGLAPVYRFWNSAQKSHFYTISATEKNYVASHYPEWQYEGIAWFSRSQTAEGYTPVYRFWSNVYKRHFFTSSEAEKNYVSNNYPGTWSYEGIAWYAK